MKIPMFLFAVFCNACFFTPALVVAGDAKSEKLIFAVWELKTKYYNAVNLYEICSSFDSKYIQLNENSFKQWFNKNNPPFERVLAVFKEDKNSYFDNPENHKNELNTHFSRMPESEKHKLCARLNEEYESNAMNLEEYYKDVFTFISVAKKSMQPK